MFENRWTIGLSLFLSVAIVGVGAYLLMRPDAAEDLGTSAAEVATPSDATPKVEPRRAESTTATTRPLSPSSEPESESTPAVKTESAAPIPRTVVRGRVVTETGEPIADAELRLLMSKAKAIREGGRTAFVRDIRGSIDERSLGKTSSDGTFELPVEVSSSIELRARPAAFCDAKKTFSVPDPTPVDLGDIVCAIGAAVEGKVTTSSGLPVKDARVRVRKTQTAGPGGLMVFGGNEDLFDGIAERTGKTDDNGFFKVAGVEPGSVSVTANSADYPQGSVRDLFAKKGETLRDVVVTLPLGRTIEGFVRGDDGAPIEGVDVVANMMDGMSGELSLEEMAASGQKKATTDAEGRFRLKGLKEAAASLSARKAGYQTVRSVNVDPDQKTVDITLLAAGIVFGYVTDSIDQKPITKFTIETLVGPEMRFARRVTANKVLTGAAAAKELGIAEAPNLYAILDCSFADLRVVGHADGYSEAMTPSVRLLPRGRVQQDVSLAREARVSGICRDSAGRPVEGASVTIGPKRNPTDAPVGGFEFTAAAPESDDAAPPSDNAPSATTDKDGRFELVGLKAGNHILRADHPKYVEATGQEIVLSPGQIIDNVILILEEGGVLAGSAFDSEGAVLAGGIVSLRPLERDEKNAVMMIDGTGADMDVGGSKSAVTEKDGKFEIRGLKAGRWTASVRAPRRGRSGANIAISIPGMSDGGRSKGIPVDIEAGKTTHVELRVPAQAVLSGKVVEAQSPVVGVKVSLVRAGTPNFLAGGPSAETDENGAFEIKGIDPGDYEMNVQPKTAPIPYSESISFAERERVVRDIRLPTGVISGKIEKKSGKEPMEGIVVTATAVVDQPANEKRTESNVTVMSIVTSDEGGDESPIIFSTGTTPVRIVSDKNGRYELRNLAPGNYKVSISGKGVRPLSQDKVAVEDGRETKNIDFAVEIGAVLTVTVEGKKRRQPLRPRRPPPEGHPERPTENERQPLGQTDQIRRPRCRRLHPPTRPRHRLKNLRRLDHRGREKVRHLQTRLSLRRGV